MQYPLISEYVRAIQDASSNLNKLAHLVPVLDDHGEPYRSSGAFAVVFKMKDEQTGKFYALKCFTEEQEGRDEAYRKIADELECVDSSYITPVKYLEKEIFVDSSCEEDEFPVLLMDWIDGETMESYIAENYQDNYAMAMLCYRFCKMAAWLRSQPFAHGDIKPDNIIVRPDGSLTLVDYDGMYVPAVKGQKSPTIGTKDFSHPQRTIDDFDETIDDFALASIALSLKAISLKPSLLDEYGAADRLLFSAEDYRDLSKSKVLAALQELMNDEEVNTLLSMFLLVCAKKNLERGLFVDTFVCLCPVDRWKNVSTKVTDEELSEAVEDAFGVKYTKDESKLLNARVGFDIEKYTIKQGTKVIADYAFGGENLKCIVIPSSVVKMGINPFSECYAAELENQSPFFVYENKMLFSENKHDLISVVSDERSYIIPNGVKRIGDSAFAVVEGEERRLEEIVIPNGVMEIGSCAFERCGMLRTIILPDSITRIGAYAFSDCRNLQSVSMSENVIEIGESAFDTCQALCRIQLPIKLKNISKRVFRFCRLLDVDIPNGVVSIGEYAFCGTGIYKLSIPDSIEEIGDFAFSSCWRMSDLIIKHSKAHIGKYAFDSCQKLKNIEISDSVSYLSGLAFENCPLPRSIYDDLVRRFHHKGFNEIDKFINKMRR